MNEKIKITKPVVPKKIWSSKSSPVLMYRKVKMPPENVSDIRMSNELTSLTPIKLTA